MDDLEETSSDPLVPYERGLPFRDVLKGSLSRFLPGSAAGLLGFLALMGWPGDFLANAPGYMALVASVTGGFALGLEAMRRWLYPDAGIDRSRSFVAGLMTGPLWFSALTLIGGLQGPLAWAVFPLLGALLAVLMFFAWLTPTPEEKRPDAARSLGEGTRPVLPHSNP